MIEHSKDKLGSGVFITFSGNCKKALTFYQTCFGGILQFEAFETVLKGYTEMPIINGSLISNRIAIYGSDLVHNEGRKLGNYMSIFLPCKDIQERKSLIEKLAIDGRDVAGEFQDQKLIEITDAFEVGWVLGV